VVVFVTLVGLVGLGVVFNYFTAAAFDQNFTTLAQQKQAMVDMLAFDLDEDIALWGDYETTRDAYEQSLISDMETIDSQPHTISVLYDQNLTQLSRRISETGVPLEERNDILDPASLPGFVTLINSEESGWWYGDTAFGAVRIYYRWVPTEGADYLMVVGISARAVSTPPEAITLAYDLILAGICALIIVELARSRRHE
jgi:hypothetical protein